MNELIQYSTEKGVALVTLADPPVNAITYEMMKELDACILEARFDNDVHAIVLVGLGEKHFCAGANVHVLREADPGFRYYFGLHASETLERLERTPKLVVAALNGHCLGGGLDLALAADLRVARRGNFQIGFPEVNLGIMPGTGGTQRLARTVGSGKAIELLAEGRTFDPDAAQALGIVQKVIDGATADEFLRKVVDYARSFCPPQRAAVAIGRMKRAVQTGMEMGITEAVAFESELQAHLFHTGDAREGLAAFGSKKKVSFRGR
jgi:enoyl-CoA hydratase/carnithine racemase